VSVHRVHELLRVDPHIAERWACRPWWVASALEGAPWVVVRRTAAAQGIAVGVRGCERGQRYGALAFPPDVREALAPEDLIARARTSGRLGSAFHACWDAARECGISVAPIGAYGFELASGSPATHARSDLDLLIRADAVAREALHSFDDARRKIEHELGVAIDVELAFGDNGVALVEALAGGAAVVAKTPHGPKLFACPNKATLSWAATRALLDELETTPKPGLVDRNGSGAHTDLSFSRLRASALALEPVFAKLAMVAAGATPSRELREEIGEIGRRGERAMLVESGGTNTHRGALWALGLLVAGAATIGARDADAIARRAAAFARLPDRFAGRSHSNGLIAARRFGARGARGQAAAGFPHVTKVALPALRRGVAASDVLLRLIATLDDTCLLHRGGAAALGVARRGARESLRAGGLATRRGRAAIERLGAVLLAHNASPGGCADVLAAALFLQAIA
jgi:triphosphoribosyl-dephospho-CoA synthase